jgi:hypothetical protein
MTTYSRTFEITRKDLGTLKMMVYREQWTQSIFECLAHAQQVNQSVGQSGAKVEVTMIDLESIPFERWLKGDTCIGTVTPPQGDDEEACKARVAYAYKAADPELNSWMDFGDDGKPSSINIAS